MASPPDAQRLFDLFCKLYELSSPSCRGNFHFQHYKDAEYQYTNLCIKDGEDIPLCIVIRQDHYYYDIMNRTALCVDTQSAHLKRYSDINIKASTYVCEPLCCLFPERLLLSLSGGITFPVDLKNIKETLIAMAEKGNLCDWKEQERKAAISSRINLGIAQASVTPIDDAIKNKIAAKGIENTNLKNAIFEPNHTQSSVTQLVYSCLFKNEILMNMLEENSSHDLLCLNDLAEYVALQVHNSFFLKIYLHSLKQQKMRLITRVDHTINSMVYNPLAIPKPSNTITLKIYFQEIIDLLWNELARYFYN